MKTPLELEFMVHYREMDASSGKWDGVRVRRLCNILNLTQPELARFVRLNPGNLAQFISKEKFPGCVRLVLDLVERSAHSSYLGKSFDKSLFPSRPSNG